MSLRSTTISYFCPECHGTLMEIVLATCPPIHVWDCLNCGKRFEARTTVILEPLPEPYEGGDA